MIASAVLALVESYGELLTICVDALDRQREIARRHGEPQQAPPAQLAALIPSHAPTAQIAWHDIKAMVQLLCTMPKEEAAEWAQLYADIIRRRLAL